MKFSANCAIAPAKVPAANGRCPASARSKAMLPPSRELEVRRRHVHRPDAPARAAAPQLECDAARAAADVEQGTVGGQPGEVDQDLGEPRAPPAEETLIGGAVVGMVGKARHAPPVSRSRP
jgi:hypothetical protein